MRIKKKYIVYGLISAVLIALVALIAGFRCFLYEIIEDDAAIHAQRAIMGRIAEGRFPDGELAVERYFLEVIDEYGADNRLLENYIFYIRKDGNQVEFLITNRNSRRVVLQETWKFEDKQSLPEPPVSPSER